MYELNLASWMRPDAFDEETYNTYDEIRERLLYPMVNEGAMILQEGMAQRASDIDVVWINGYGWPLWTGGPMFWASTIGLENVVAGLEKYGLPVSDFLRARAAARGGFE